MTRSAPTLPALVATLLVAAAVAPVAGGAADAVTHRTADRPDGAAAAAAQPSASISPSVVREHRGDIAVVTVKASSRASVHVGSRETGFLLRVNVSKGTTKLRLNTYATDPEAFVQTDVRNVTMLSSPISNPLVTGTYPLNVTIDGVERAVSALEIEPREPVESDLLVAPSAVDLEANDAPADVRKHAVPVEDYPVARGDWLVVRLNATGVGGFLNQSALAADDATDGALTFVSNASRNEQPTEFAGDEVAEFVANRSGDTYYAVVDTADHGVRAASLFNATFRLGADNPVTDGEEATSAEFVVTRRQVGFDYEGSRLTVENETTIRATTTLAPGSEFEVTARSDGTPPYFETETATVAANRTFAVSYDFSSVPPGREFQLRLPAFDRRVPLVKATPEPTTTTPPDTTTPPSTSPPTTATSTVVPTTVTTGPPATTTDPTPNTTTATPAGPSTVSTAPPLTRQSVESGGQPGFGALPALLAVLAAVLLAARRPNH